MSEADLLLQAWDELYVAIDRVSTAQTHSLSGRVAALEEAQQRFDAEIKRYSKGLSR